jgi:hypothetical protein
MLRESPKRRARSGNGGLLLYFRACSFTFMTR